MAKQLEVKCLYCGKYFYREDVDFVQIGRRYAHKQCADNYVDYNNKIHQLMKNLLGIEYSYSRIANQIKRIKEQEQTNDEEIYKTLDYWYNTLHNSTEKANGGIGIVPFILGQYRRWAIEQKNIANINKGKHIKQYIQETKVVTGKAQPITRPRHIRFYDLD